MPHPVGLGVYFCSNPHTLFMYAFHQQHHGAKPWVVPLEQAEMPFNACYISSVHLELLRSYLTAENAGVTATKMLRSHRWQWQWHHHKPPEHLQRSLSQFVQVSELHWRDGHILLKDVPSFDDDKGAHRLTVTPKSPRSVLLRFGDSHSIMTHIVFILINPMSVGFIFICYVSPLIYWGLSFILSPISRFKLNFLNDSGTRPDCSLLNMESCSLLEA